MSITFPGESAEYRAAHDRLLDTEVELRRAMEAVAAARREPPPGGPVPEDYVFRGMGVDGDLADLRLSELFAPGKDSLVIYSFMFPAIPATSGRGRRLANRRCFRSRRAPARCALRCSTSSTARPSMLASASTRDRGEVTANAHPRFRERARLAAAAAFVLGPPALTTGITTARPRRSPRCPC